MVVNGEISRMVKATNLFLQHTFYSCIVCKLNFQEHLNNNNINSNNNLLLALHLIKPHALNSHHGNPFKEEI